MCVEWRGSVQHLEQQWEQSIAGLNVCRSLGLQTFLVSSPVQCAAKLFLFRLSSRCHAKNRTVLQSAAGVVLTALRCQGERAEEGLGGTVFSVELSRSSVLA